MKYSAKELDLQKSVSYYEIESKVNSIFKFDEFGNPTDWFDLKDLTTDEIMKKHKIDSSKMNLFSLNKLKKVLE